MDSHVTSDFRRLFKRLPANVRREARDAYSLWKADPFANGLHFKPVAGTKFLWSVRTALGWRALGVRQDPSVIHWVWIGSHADYDKLIAAKRASKHAVPES